MVLMEAVLPENSLLMYSLITDGGYKYSHVLELSHFQTRDLAPKIETANLYAHIYVVNLSPHHWIRADRVCVLVEETQSRDEAFSFHLKQIEISKLIEM